MAIKLASNLSRNRYGVLHFRLSVPPDLQPHFRMKEIYRSLHTASINDAAIIAQTLSITFKRVFKEIRCRSMPSNKKKPTDPLEGSDWGLITELSIDEFMRPKLKLIPEPGDTPEDRIQAQVEFMRAIGFAGAGQQAPAGNTQRLSEYIAPYIEDEALANKQAGRTLEAYKAAINKFIEIVVDNVTRRRLCHPFALVLSQRL